MGGSWETASQLRASVPQESREVQYFLQDPLKRFNNESRRRAIRTGKIAEHRANIAAENAEQNYAAWPGVNDTGGSCVRVHVYRIR